nr:MAG TPA: hypothetical protein [Caudoviricetes sp.]
MTSWSFFDNPVGAIDRRILSACFCMCQILFFLSVSVSADVISVSSCNCIKTAP